MAPTITMAKKQLPALLTFLSLILLQSSSFTDALAANRKPQPRKPIRKPLWKRPLKDKLQAENDLKRDHAYVLGSDDSGNGCIAGPVVCATCCLLNDDHVLAEVDDSKRLTPETRQSIYQHIVDHPETFVWSVATRSNTVIDETSLEQATKECFQESIESVVQQIQQSREEEEVPLKDFYSIVDGHRRPSGLSITSRPWKGGDEMVYTVALASVLARHHHEQIMLQMALEHPNYAFQDNLGYPNKDHFQALHTHGPTSVHRMSCKPVQNR